jgi:Mce-associated membrane protein
MMWQHHATTQQRQRAAEFSAAARQSVVTMMSLNPATIRQDMQRVVENSTGRFKRALEEAGGADEIVKRVEQSKVSTKVTVQSVAIENMSGDSAVVLVSALSEGTGPDNQKLPPAPWRISVSLNNDDGQLKTSEFEFVQ